MENDLLRYFESTKKAKNAKKNIISLTTKGLDAEPLENKQNELPKTNIKEATESMQQEQQNINKHEAVDLRVATTNENNDRTTFWSICIFVAINIGIAFLLRTEITTFWQQNVIIEKLLYLILYFGMIIIFNAFIAFGSLKKLNRVFDKISPTNEEQRNTNKTYALDTHTLTLGISWSICFVLWCLMFLYLFKEGLERGIFAVCAFFMYKGGMNFSLKVSSQFFRTLHSEKKIQFDFDNWISKKA